MFAKVLIPAEDYIFLECSKSERECGSQKSKLICYQKRDNRLGDFWKLAPISFDGRRPRQEGFTPIRTCAAVKMEGPRMSIIGIRPAEGRGL